MLTFIYGTMGAGKSYNMINSYDVCKKDTNGQINILVLRFKLYDEDKNIVKSRDGSKIPCRLFDRNTDFEELFFYERWSQNYDYIFIDEIQFCSRKQIGQLYRISRSIDINCYGLLLDQTGRLFEASERLIEMSDLSYRIPSDCGICGCAATTDAMYEKKHDRWVRYKGFSNGEPKPPNKGLQYVPMCRCCFEHTKYDTITQEQLDYFLTPKIKYSKED